jgi:hypothetical protein
MGLVSEKPKLQFRDRFTGMSDESKDWWLRIARAIVPSRVARPGELPTIGMTICGSAPVRPWHYTVGDDLAQLKGLLLEREHVQAQIADIAEIAGSCAPLAAWSSAEALSKTLDRHLSTREILDAVRWLVIEGRLPLPQIAVTTGWGHKGNSRHRDLNTLELVSEALDLQVAGYSPSSADGIVAQELTRASVTNHRKRLHEDLARVGGLASVD